MKKIGVIIFTILLISSTSAFAILNSQKVVPSTGIVVIVQPSPPPNTIGLETYSDAKGIMKITSVNWGVLNPGSIGHVTIYLMNTGNTVGVVTVVAGNCNPLKTQNITKLSWDKNGVTLGAGQIIQANLTLEVSGSVEGVSEFAFDIIFTIEG